MANKVTIKRSSVAGKAPVAGDLEVGELAVNLADHKLFTKDGSGTIIELGSSGGGGGGTSLPADAAGALTNDGSGNLSWAAAASPLPANTNGVLTNDGTGALSWATVPFGDIAGTPTTLAGYGITDAAAAIHTHLAADITDLSTLLATKQDNLPASAAGHLANDGSGGLSWQAPLALGTSATTAATGDHSHAVADMTDWPANKLGLLRNDGAGNLTWFDMPTSGMSFVGAIDPASMPATAKSGDFAIFNKAGTVAGATVNIGDMAVNDGAKWSIIPATQDLSAYILAPPPGSGFLHRSGGGVIAWQATPKAPSMTLASGGKGATLTGTPTGGISITDIASSLKLLGIDASGQVTIGDLAGTGSRMVVASATGQLSTMPAPTWVTLGGKPATFPPTIGSTATTAAAGNHNHDTRYLRLTGGTVRGLTTFSGAANANIRLSNAAFHNVIALGTDAQGDLVPRTSIPWANISGKPAIGTPNISRTGTFTTNRLAIAASASALGTSQDIRYAGGAAGFYVGGMNISCSKDIVAFYSDMRLKNPVGYLNDALEKVRKLDGFIYTPNDLARSIGAVDGDDYDERVGVSAQSVMSVLPQAVTSAPFDLGEDGTTSASGENYLTVDYSKMVPLLIEAIKTLADEMENMKNV